MNTETKTHSDENLPYTKRLQTLIADRDHSEISLITGIDQQTVTDYISGNLPLSLNFLSGLASCGMDIHYILTGRKSEETAQYQRLVTEYENLIARDEEIQQQLDRLTDPNGSLFGPHNNPEVDRLQALQQELRGIKQQILESIKNKEAE